MIYNCYGCRQDFFAKTNIARITISCPICNTNLNIAQSLGRFYGEIIGKQISDVMSKLERVLAKSRSGDMSPAILLSQNRIENLCEGKV